MKRFKFKGIKIKSLKYQILTNIISLVLIAVVFLGSMSAYLNYNTVLETLELTLTETAEVASYLIESELKNYKMMAADIGLEKDIASMDVSTEEKKAKLKEVAERFGYTDIYIISQDGSRFTINTNVADNVADTDYFQEAINGESYITDAIFHNEGTENMDMHFIISAPIWENGKYDSNIVGVAAIEIDGVELSDIVSKINVGEGSNAFIKDDEGYTIANLGFTSVMERHNSIHLYEQNGTGKDLAMLDTGFITGEINYGTYELDGIKKILAYSPIEGTNGWGVRVNTPQSLYMNSTIYSIILTFIAAVLLTVCSVITGIRSAKKIGDPIVASANRLKLLSEGDLSTVVPKTTRDDETGLLLNSLDKTVNVLKTIIKDISYHLGEMSEGNFTTTVEVEYKGDLGPIEKSIKKIIKFLNDTMSQIDESADQVAMGAEQVSAGAQALSQGTTEQASSIEELAATINEMTEQIQHNASNAESAKISTLEAANEVENGSQQLKYMLQSISEINETSVQIGKIIKVIDDIAFQTNILALNAAVEAARAGSAGKGFAVVADEVGNLASKSAEAAKNTTQLIETSLSAILKGTKIAEKTEKSFNLIVDKVDSTVSLVEEIAAASEQQAIAVSQVNTGIEQISVVVQTNSATAEESAATSEELRGQAQVLKNLLNKLNLK